jgi:hypothetical protein
MSIYSYMEIVQPDTEIQNDEDPRKEFYMEFGHGIHWSYQIAVAGGKRIYAGVQHGAFPLEPQLDDYTALSVYEQGAFQALQNYQTAIQACISAVRLKVPEQQKWLRDDLEFLFTAQEWFYKAWLKLPDGIVRLDWSERTLGMSEKDIALWDSPNSSLAFFVQLSADCESVLTNKLTVPEFTAKYSGEHGGDKKLEIEL